MELSTPQGKNFVHELTIEYIKQNELLKCLPRDIDSQIAKIAEISETISNAVAKRYHSFNFL